MAYDFGKIASGGAQGIGSALNYFMSDPSKPYQDASAQLDKYYGQAQDALSPYMNAGQNALGNYQNALSPMSNSPQFINNILNQYQESPWAKFQQQYGMKAMQNAASAGGMQGSGAQWKAAADYSQGISSRDMQQWLQNNLGVNDRYLSGQQDISHMGFGGAQSLAQLLGQLGQAQAGMAYGAGQAQNQGTTDMLGGVIGGGLDIAKGLGWL
jgi:hypothetical protein